jgi:hypothetical protein
MGGNLRKIAATALAGALLAAAPALAQQAGRASATDGYLHIGGGNRLAATSSLRIPIRCSIDCDTTAFTKLTTPADVIGPDKATGHLKAGKPMKLIVTLNDDAAADVQAHPNSRLKVKVSAVSSDGNQRANAVKVFRFTGS